jgi:hydrogenase maturation protease
MVMPAVADLAIMTSCAIIGCGNPNRCDDGVAARVLHLLHNVIGDHNGVHLLDAGTDGIRVMFAARGCTALIIIDACRSGSETGAIFEVPGAELAQPPPDSFNLHDFRWDHALYAGRRIFADDFPPEVTVFLIEAERVEYGTELSPAVAAAAERVAGIITDRVRAKYPVEEPA